MKILFSDEFSASHMKYYRKERFSKYERMVAFFPPSLNWKCYLDILPCVWHVCDQRKRPLWIVVQFKHTRKIGPHYCQRAWFEHFQDQLMRAMNSVHGMRTKKTLAVRSRVHRWVRLHWCKLIYPNSLAPLLLYFACVCSLCLFFPCYSLLFFWYWLFPDDVLFSTHWKMSLQLLLGSLFARSSHNLHVYLWFELW